MILDGSSDHAELVLDGLDIKLQVSPQLPLFLQKLEYLWHQHLEDRGETPPALDSFTVSSVFWWNLVHRIGESG